MGEVEFKDYNADNISQMFVDMKEDFKKRNPIGYYLDEWFYKKFNNHGIAGYAPHYTLTHPWIILQDMGRNIKWAFQRVFKGWDERTVWSLDRYLAKMIPIWMRELKSIKQGIPVCMYDRDVSVDKPYYSEEETINAEKNWNEVLDSIADGFDAYIEIDERSLWINDPEYEELKFKFDKAFIFLREYFGSFWD